MPNFRGLTVRIIDGNNKPLEEYGTRSLERASTISSYIQSKSDLQFKVEIQPDIPFPISHDTRAQEVAASRAKKREALEKHDKRREGIRSRENDRRVGRYNKDSYQPNYE